MRLRELGRFSQWCLLMNSQSCFYLFFNHWNGFHSQVPRIKFFQILHVKTASGLKGYVYFQPFLKKKKNKKTALDRETLDRTVGMVKWVPAHCLRPRAAFGTSGSGNGTECGRCQMGEIFWGKSTPALHINENCIFFLLWQSSIWWLGNMFLNYQIMIKKSKAINI